MKTPLMGFRKSRSVYKIPTPVRLSHFFRLVEYTGKTGKSLQVNYYGSFYSPNRDDIENFEGKMNLINKFLEVLIDTTTIADHYFEPIYLHSFEVNEAACQTKGEDLIVVVFGSEEVWLLVFNKQARRKKAIFRSLKYNVFNYCLQIANKQCIVVQEYPYD